MSAAASSTSVGRQILSATALIAAITVVVRLVTVGRDLALSWTLGRADAVDAFLVASALPLFLVSILSTAFSGALIPATIRQQETKGEESARRLLGTFTVLLAGVLVVLALALVVGARWYVPLVAGGFSPAKQELTRQLMVFQAPMLITGGLAGVYACALNAEKRFLATAVAPLAVPLCSLLVFLLLWESLGITAMAVGVVVGSVLEVAFLLGTLKRLGLSFPHAWSGLDPGVRQTLRQFLPILAGSMLMGMTTLVNQIMAASLSAGSVAALSYASKIVSLPQSIAVTAIGVAVVPFLSRMAATSDYVALQRTVNLGLRAILLASVPAALALALLSEPIVAVVFQRGSFTASDTVIVAGVQACLALQIPFYMASIFIVRAVSALQVNRLLAIGSGINLVACILLNLALAPVLGVAGIALATSIVYMISFVFLYAGVNRRLREVSA